jgi:predicted Zn-dependent peptidase
VERERQVIVGEFHRYFPQKFRFDLNTRESRALYSGYWLERYCSPLGNPESVGRISESDLQSFYDRHYTPANISVVGVGGLKLLELMRLLSKSPFAIRKEGKRTVLPKKVSEVSPPLENRCVFEMSSEMQTPTEVGDYRSVAKLPGAVNGRAVNLLSHMLDKVLKEEVRERRAWAYHIDSDWNYFRHFYEFEIECQSLALCALDTIEEVVETCITSLNDREDLFERTKRSALAGTYLVDPNAHDICNGAMSDLAKHQRIVTLHEYYKQYKQLKMDDIRGLLHSLRPEMRYTLIIRP